MGSGSQPIELHDIEQPECGRLALAALAASRLREPPAMRRLRRGPNYRSSWSRQLGADG